MSINSKQAITPNTKALVPVHLTGDVAEMPRIVDIAKRHKLAVIEDGCQSLLGEYQGRRVGTWGDATAFSMHPLKNHQCVGRCRHRRHQ